MAVLIKLTGDDGITMVEAVAALACGVFALYLAWGRGSRFYLGKIGGNPIPDWLGRVFFTVGGILCLYVGLMALSR
jgi:hypothetical protein